MEKPVKIIITDDVPAFRRSVKASLDDYNIVTLAEAGNGLQLLELLKSHKPDVILLDLKMPVMNGNETLQQLTELHPDIKVIVTSYLDDSMLVEDYELRGVKGYLSKDGLGANAAELVAAIRRVHKGGKYFNVDRQAKTVKLSPRQKEIINLVSAGKSKTEIATELGLTRSGVDKQEKKIWRMFGVNSLAGLLSRIFDKGLNFFEPPKHSANKIKRPQK